MKAAEKGQTPAAVKTVENARKYKEVYRGWLSGIDWPALSEMHGLSERRCQQVVDELRAGSVAVLALDNPQLGVRWAQDMLLRRGAAVSEAARLAVKAEAAGNWAVALGAMRRRDEALTLLGDLMVEMDLIPKHLGAVRVQLDAMFVARVFLEVAEKYQIPEAAQREMVEALELRAKRGESGRLELDMGAPGGIEEVEVVDGEAA